MSENDREESVKRIYLVELSDLNVDDDPAMRERVAEVVARGRQRTSLIDLFNLCFSRLFLVLALLVPGCEIHSRDSGDGRA